MITRIRSQQIYIDLPTPDSEPWINIIVQRVEMSDDYETMNVVDRWDQVNERLSDIITETYQYSDPVTSTPWHISTAGLADAITKLATKLIISKCGGYVDDKGYIIIEE